LSDSKPPTPITDEQRALAEETAVRTAEEITGRHRLTPEQRAALQDAPDDRVAAPVRVVSDKTTFSWPVVVLVVMAAIAVGGALWQTNANADDLKKIDLKADAATVATLEARVRVLETDAAAARGEQKTAHQNIDKKLDQVDGKLDRLIERVK
jgi:hypothetical protein